MATEGEFPKVDGDILYATEVNSFIRNSSRGITPTVLNTGSWNLQVPNNLSNFTDGDFTTSTGIGVGSAAGTNEMAIMLDLGSNVYHSSVGAKYTFTSPSDTVSLQSFIDVSQDDSTYLRIGSFTGQVSGTVTIDSIINPSLTNSKFRYVKLGIHTAGTIAGSVTWEGQELVIF